ncbi:MAG: MerR family transcriptional regulator [Phenylobacterium sp.]|uniref:MerR family transcriptional regulator n=1 Tax=Phenylobacterium sp. TaxID=1871053 RepID=UPI0027374A7F|nr:MerR family transcriptional regulator [Phenylobacterium sp.]MDP3747840.1 MerR family transcriptional regulator [Phenylobacterium sp.]
MAKGPDAFRTISEAADELNVPQHVLRFWETKFSFIRPMKRAGGRRFYRPQDIQVLRGVRGLLHDQGYTIKGVQKLHKDQGLKRLLDAASGTISAPAAGHGHGFDVGADRLSEEGRERLQGALDDLEAAKARLDRLLGR